MFINVANVKWVNEVRIRVKPLLIHCRGEVFRDCLCNHYRELSHVCKH